LCAIVALPQSTVSRHLKVLADEGWAAFRAEGSSRHYRLAPSLDDDARALWDSVKGAVTRTAAAGADAARVTRVLAARASRSREFFSTAAGRWDAMRSELFGASADLALLALLDDRWVVGDLGCGTGVLAAALSPYVKSVVGVDASAEMLAAAATRLAGDSNVDLRAGDLEHLPLADGELDAAVLFLVLHYVADPAAALAEASRALRPGGRLLVVDMTPHDRVDYAERMGHIWLGFDREQITGWLTDAGLECARYADVPVDPQAQGPKLFAVVARREEVSAVTNERN
jgi:ArsR family transcriptional regulator